MKWQGGEKLERTRCACELCKIGCRTMPGTLAPGDAQRIAQRMGSEATPEWAEQWLEASDGIKMVRVLPAGGIEVTQIPTIVPRLTEGGCVFWTSSGRCAIHEVAPAGCAFFDAHLSPEEADTRSLALALAVRDEQDDVYRQIGSHLWSIGAIARPLHERRENYRVAETDLLDKPTRVQ